MLRVLAGEIAMQNEKFHSASSNMKCNNILFFWLRVTRCVFIPHYPFLQPC